jgi:hypothetical protein
VLLAHDLPPITCSVLGESQGRGIRFRGRIVSPEGAAGTYLIVIRKSGPSGTSNVSQGGAFTAAAGAETLVGSATLSLEPGADYGVTMQVDADGRSFTCETLSGGTL